MAILVEISGKGDGCAEMLVLAEAWYLQNRPDMTSVYLTLEEIRRQESIGTEQEKCESKGMHGFRFHEAICKSDGRSAKPLAKKRVRLLKKDRITW